MKSQRKAAPKTPQNLLAAASAVFAHKGYRDATIAEICERAGANVAAANYHFGDKETLYKEAWRHSFSESVKSHPPDGGVSDNAPPEERLRGRVAALLCRIADKTSHEFLFVQKELAHPTGLLDEVMQREIRPLREKMETLVRELLGPRASDMQVRFCVTSIITQCINPMVATKGRKKMREGKASARVDDIEAYSNHVVSFSFGGIRAIRDEAKKKRSGFKRQRVDGKILRKA